MICLGAKAREMLVSVTNPSLSSQQDNRGLGRMPPLTV